MATKGVGFRYPMLLLLAAVAASAAAQSRPAMPGATTAPFAAAVARDIEAVARFEPGRAALLPPPPGDEMSLILYEAGNPGIARIRCERYASFRIVAQQAVQGSIGVGVCDANARQVRASAVAGKAGLAALLDGAGAARPAGERAALGLEWKETPASNGARLYDVPIPMLAQGAVVIHTAVLVTRAADRAVVVQAELSQWCDAGRASSPLCTSTARALGDIAIRVDAGTPKR